MNESNKTELTGRKANFEDQLSTLRQHDYDPMRTEGLHKYVGSKARWINPVISALSAGVLVWGLVEVASNEGSLGLTSSSSLCRDFNQKIRRMSEAMLKAVNHRQGIVEVQVNILNEI